MPKVTELGLFTHEGFNPYTDEYTNILWGRRRANGMFTLWVHYYGIDASGRACWQKNIKTPEEFVVGCLTCFDFVNFNYACEDQIYEDVLPVLKKLDEKFAEEVRAYLEKKYYPDGFPEGDEEVQLEPKAGGRIHLR